MGLIDWITALLSKKKLTCPYKDGFTCRTSSALRNHLKAAHRDGKINLAVHLT